MIHPVRNTAHASARADGRVMDSGVAKVLVAVTMFLGFVTSQTPSASKTSVAAKVMITRVGGFITANGTSHI